MAGIYIHIPYCRQACRYCDFHFVVSVWQKKEILPHILKEVESRREYLNGELINSIYFGGGTPSVLEMGEIASILESIKKNYTIGSEPEISFEANPEDLKKEYLTGLREIGINRLSIGIQSFHNSDLELMHRIHSAEQAITCVKDAKDVGFDNISIDLIYGIPRQEAGVWEENLDIAFSLRVQHFSAYHLTYEAGTIFDHWVKKGRIKPIQEEDSIQQFKTLLKKSRENGFEHYEISNFSLPGFQSRHNSSYWHQEKYIGVGPSAHSFDGKSRRWNFKSNKKYSENISNGTEYFETEVLTEENQYNEFIMTNMRTMAGVSLATINERFGKDYANYFLSQAEKFVENGSVKREGEIFRFSEEGIFISDHIISEIFK